MLSIFEIYYIDNFEARNEAFNTIEFKDFCKHFQRVLPLAEAHRNPAVREAATSFSISLAFDVYNDCAKNGPTCISDHI